MGSLEAEEKFAEFESNLDFKFHHCFTSRREVPSFELRDIAVCHVLKVHGATFVETQPPDDLYALLEVPHNATMPEIHLAYRRIKFRYSSTNDSDQLRQHNREMMSDVKKAHSILTNEKKRQIYDKYGQEGLDISEKIGDENVPIYFVLKHPCIKVRIL
ncbi:hypothetical protein HELRODRAFT_174628 [Helobdella robusta]|uniref:J domain-containing protein n=1 Tax=Helobdella robusta TaxID=6412 RepID=T1F8B3_HELRO|nr:hypothetical protein HELRODRAFT_174628 [Helobdella robusta]ESO01666.1 hypothetical protein HELRODRAFT_174628 [Helobdella robusta]